MSDKKAAELFVSEYLEKIFYFCLKKTSDPHQAEELSADIALNVLIELNKGTVIENFPAWVWRIARSRYSVWADRKHRRNETFVSTDISELEYAGDRDVTEDVIKKEQLSLLRRELAFISADYRVLLVAYYIDGVRIKRISEKTGIPEGTVMRRLHDARNKLKEGMNMAREFGKRSYDPEDISFIGSGNHTSGLPDKVIHRKIPKNILCEAHNNPCTVDELAMELGIAVPYMEEEVEILYNAELLKKVGKDRYITSFFITPTECRNECLELCCKFAEDNYANIWELAGITAEKAKEKGVTFGGYGDGDIKMFFALKIEKMLEDGTKYCKYKEFKRGDGGTWGVIGFEQKGVVCRLNSEWFNNNLNLTNDLKIIWGGFQTNSSAVVFTKARYAYDYPDCSNLPLLKRIAEGKDDFSDTENGIIDRLIKHKICIRDGGGLKVNAVTYTQALCDGIVDFFKGTDQYKTLQQNAATLDKSIYDTVKKYANPYIEEDLGYCGYMNMRVREILARLLYDKGCYQDHYGQFCEFVY
ncbi:MAG: RNA polymerase sigma factor [Clostridia bacterium]|nr:RNA polymerase sigma factor [Clostridia bacterium]